MYSRRGDTRVSHIKMSNNNNNNNLGSSKRRKRRRKGGSNPSDKAPVAQSKAIRVKKASMSNFGDNFRVKKSEFISSITDAASFTVVQFPINPGLSETFPWLSAIAVRYDEYIFHSLTFEYITRTATTTISSVVLAPDYDAIDPIPADEATITSYQDAIEDSCWKDIKCYLSKRNMFPNGFKYVRDRAVAGDLKTYDAGNLFVSVDGATTNVLGKLWVHYDVEFRAPQISATAPSSSKLSRWNLSVNQTLATGVAEDVAYDEVVVNPLNIINTAGAFTLPKGAYYVQSLSVFEDSVGGVDTSTIINPQLDSANFVPPVRVIQQNTYTANVSDYHIVNNFYVVSDGTNVLTMEATISSASGGALKLNADQCRIDFLLV